MAPLLLASAGLLLCGVGLLDPQRVVLVWPGLIAVAAAFWLAPTRPWIRTTAALAAAYALAAACAPEFRADSTTYFVYLRSAAFDGDLDMDNEFAHWGYDPLPRTVTGRAQNSQSIGPALLWSPFYGVAHLYVVSGLGAGHAADGYSAPYRRAAALGTVTAVTLAMLLLTRRLALRHGPAIATLTAAAIFGGTSLAYYTLVVPTMAHGAAFAAVVLHLYLLERARETLRVRDWAWLGASLGAAMLFRPQALVLALLSAPTALALLWTRRLSPAAVAAAAGAGIAAFFPQMAVWKHLFGSWWTQPQGGRFMDWSSPHLLDTLVSADHGLFSWTPVAALGAVGLVLLLRDAADRRLAAGALLAFAATAWVNGGVDDWAASDAFGGRRYDIVLPLLALGLAAFIARSVAIVARRPLLAPAAAMTLLLMWNLGFIAVFRSGAYPGAAPLERLASDQARLLRRLSERALGAVFGPRGRAFAYEIFRAEYFYTGYNPGGTIAPAGDHAERYLLGGWAKPGRRPEGPAFRWAMAPAACVRVPLAEPFAMEIGVTAFAPGGASPQTMSVAVNGVEVGAAELTPEWSEPRFQIPAARLVPGENELCLRFARAMPQEGGVAIAAGVARIQLP